MISYMYFEKNFHPGCVLFQVVSGCEGEDDGDEFADEPVNELYSPEDIPYNMRFLRSPDIKSITAWRTHSGPEIRPLFVRQAHRVQPRPLSPPDDWEERYDNSSGAQSEGDHDGSDGGVLTKGGYMLPF